MREPRRPWHRPIWVTSIAAKSRDQSVTDSAYLSTLALDYAPRIAQAMVADRHRLSLRWQNIQRAARVGRPFDRDLDRLVADLDQSEARVALRRASVPPVCYDEDLPIVARRDEVARAILDHQVVVVCGETGSGKSTQLPKICLEIGRGVAGCIGHTQPRRIAARSVAARVAAELAVPLGGAVGYKVRFQDATSPQTLVKLLTDGVLLAETQQDRFLNQYDTIILDEAHERSLNVDFLLGLLRQLLPRRPDLKVVITSATIDAQRFSRHFATPDRAGPVISIEGRTYPVEVRYRPPPPGDDGEPNAEQGVLDAVGELWRESAGDLLVFVPTEQQIYSLVKTLRKHGRTGATARATEIVPLYARLSAAEQNRVFQPHSGRRIVIATNVAESSLTVPGIRAVVDTGTARISRYSPRSKVQRLPIEPISRASADQRRGRCGRLGPGVCIRLYSQEDFESRDAYTPPEIQRTNLAGVILQTLSLSLGRAEDFPFLDPPRPDAIREGYRTLFELGAVDGAQQLTDLGRRMSRMPVDPSVARMILAAHEEGSLEEVLIIASALEIQDVRERPIDRQEIADGCHAQFLDPASDFVGILNLWDFQRDLKGRLSQNQFRKACQQNFLSYNRLREWSDLHRQLEELVRQAGLRPGGRRNDYAQSHRALLAGLVSTVALKGEGFEYTVAGGQKVHLWPGSGTFDQKPKWVMGAELVETTRRYLRWVARIDPKWIEQVAPHLVKHHYGDPAWDEDRAAAVCLARTTLGGLALAAARQVPLAAHDPVLARQMFIEHALVEGRWEHRGRFFDRNQSVLAQVDQLETRARRRDLFKGEAAVHAFYHQRLPADVCDCASFDRWRRQQPQAAERLHMTLADVARADAADLSLDDFPDTLALGPLRLALDYCFEPGSATDGVTLRVPREMLPRLDGARLEWLVPGLLTEKVMALIRTLPKPLRRSLVPARQVAQDAAGQLRDADGSLLASLAAALSRLAAQPIRPGDFQLDQLPEHLRFNIAVIDDKGQVLAAGRNLALVRQQLGGMPAADLARLDDPRWRKTGIESWDVGDLPIEVDVVRKGIHLAGFPALVDDGDTVSLRLFHTRQAAEREHHCGVLRLAWRANRRALREQIQWLPDIGRLLLWAAPLRQDVTEHLSLRLAQRAYLPGEATPHTRADFDECLRQGNARIGPAVQELVAVIRPLLENYHQALLAVQRADGRPLLSEITTDVADQIVRLTTDGFLCQTPWAWLRHFPRYFKAIQLRLEKALVGGADRDARARPVIAALEEPSLRELEAARLRQSIDPSLEQFRWLIEELRVSLFAQQLGTADPVSEQRLRQQWAKLQSGEPRG